MPEWVVLAEAPSLEELGRVTPSVSDLPKGSPVRVVMHLRMPFGYAFNLAGAETIFRPVTPPGLILKDVRGEGPMRAIIDYEVDPAWIPAILAFLAANWVKISLVAIGITLSLSMLVGRFSLETVAEIVEPIPKAMKWGAIALIVFLAFSAYKKTKEVARA